MFCVIDDVVFGSAIPKKRDVRIVAIGENANTQSIERSGKEVGGPEDPCLLRCPSLVGTSIKAVYKNDASTIGVSSA